MTNKPPLPDGSSRLVQFCRTILRMIEERTIRNSPDIYVQEGPTGVTLRIKPQLSKSAPGGNDKPVYL